MLLSKSSWPYSNTFAPLPNLIKQSSSDAVSLFPPAAIL